MMEILLEVFIFLVSLGNEKLVAGQTRKFASTYFFKTKKLKIASAESKVSKLDDVFSKI